MRQSRVLPQAAMRISCRCACKTAETAEGRPCWLVCQLVTSQGTPLCMRAWVAQGDNGSGSSGRVAAIPHPHNLSRFSFRESLPLFLLTLNGGQENMTDSSPEQVDPEAAEKKTPSFFSCLRGVALKEPIFTLPSSNQQTSTVQPPSPTLPAAPQCPASMPSGRGLGALTADLLKPKLKQWVDQKLEGVVERLIREEIKRIAGSN